VAKSQSSELKKVLPENISSVSYGVALAIAREQEGPKSRTLIARYLLMQISVHPAKIP